ncbi:hypothetical protein BU26DRAFT_134398 [Trematosphaeria pertusa]|uniref:Uncharacterized protein n=1 Tax=Trematosphaeria pertusa TaxID=390896 RepID=A0A6A6IUC4_9PLEO|nr:uncharacterized protein BU26DRAFT_134398 [Trematosphaeria pertusa]KAF2254151.1 hypothetical protein BU26DRAFT_134398 [Trematosphaeria pertusa]
MCGGHTRRVIYATGAEAEELMVNNPRFAAGDRVVGVNQKERHDARQLFLLLGTDEG